MSTATAPLRRLQSTSRRQTRRQAQSINVGDKERLLSLRGGAALGLYGLSRRSLGGLALAAVSGSLVYRGVTGHCGAYQALGVSTAEPVGPATSVRAGHGVKVEERILINRDAATLWRFWRKLENLGRFMRHLERVEEIDTRRSRWVAHAPLGINLQWEAEIINEKENELIARRSVDNSEVDTAGSVHFRELPNAGWSVEHQVRLLAQSAARHCHRPFSRPAAHGA
jgi:uncharacterized membrane protein